MRKLSNAVLAVILVSALTLTMTFSVLATASSPDISKSAQFTLGNSYEISVHDTTTLEFPSSSVVDAVDSTSEYETSELIVYLKHNYDVQVSATGTAFNLDTGSSDYSSSYAIDAKWLIKWASGSETLPPADTNSGQGNNNWTDSSASNFSSSNYTTTYDASVDSTSGDVWGKFSVKADRNGYDDPQGTYTATLNITVSDLT